MTTASKEMLGWRGSRLEVQDRSSSAGTQQWVLAQEMRKPAQELPQVLMRSGSPLLFGFPTFCHLLAPFPLSLCLYQAPHSASAAETNFWFLRTTNPETAGVSEVQEIASLLWEISVCQLSQCRDHHFQVGGDGGQREMGSRSRWELQLKKRWGALEMQKHVGTYPCCHTTRYPYAGTEHVHRNTALPQSFLSSSHKGLPWSFSFLSHLCATTGTACCISHFGSCFPK